MATSKDYINFIMEQLSALDGVETRRMMGEYIIYFRGKIAAYVCDNRLLVKLVSHGGKVSARCKARAALRRREGYAFGGGS